MTQRQVYWAVLFRGTRTWTIEVRHGCCVNVPIFVLRYSWGFMGCIIFWLCLFLVGCFPDFFHTFIAVWCLQVWLGIFCLFGATNISGKMKKLWTNSSCSAHPRRYTEPTTPLAGFSLPWLLQNCTAYFLFWSSSSFSLRRVNWWNETSHKVFVSCLFFIKDKRTEITKWIELKKK